MTTVSLPKPLRRIVRSATKRAAAVQRQVQLRADRSALSARLNGSGQRGLFIDCGSNQGQGFRYFSQFFAPALYDAILIEPNPHCWASLQDEIAKSAATRRIRLIKAAASTDAGTAQFFGLTERGDNPLSEGGSIVAGHNSALYESDPNSALTVETISLADLIVAQAQTYDAIVMKLDIEGAELDVLDHLLSTGAIDRLYALYVEFHAQYMAEPERHATAARERALVDAIRARGTVRLRLWI